MLQHITGVTAVVLLLRCVFGYAPKKRGPAVWMALFAAAAAQAGVLLLSRARPDAAADLQEALIFAGAVAAPYLLLRGRRKRTFFLFGLAYCATTDYIAALAPARYAGAVGVLVDAAAGLLAFLVCKAGRKAPPDFPDQVPVWVYITVFVADLSAYYSGMLPQDASYFAEVSAVLKALSLLLIGGSIGWLVRRYLQAQRAEQFAAKQLALQLRHYEELVEKSRLARSLRHDYENNLLSLGVILDAGQTQQARDYVRQLQGEVHAASFSAVTGNWFADAILAEKKAAAAEKSIELSFCGTVPAGGIADPDLCTILCNLLDNAISGCSACAPCTVELEGREAPDRWLLTVKNPVAQKVIIRGGTVPTSKTDAKNHGFGLANVRRAAEKYNGYLELNCSDHCFAAEVGLMLNTEESK